MANGEISASIDDPFFSAEQLPKNWIGIVRFRRNREREYFGLRAAAILWPRSL
jgi:hypothetical protein